ncbi:MAG: trimeric intracellular cation channel family protein, partial [Pseudomonadota bacterium]|nr:trimeric intracellular cation channel family protein [Pseudomonadota bacterium]
LYVTAAALAAGLLVLLIVAGVAVPVAVVLAAASGFALRGLAIARGWSLPMYRD